VGESKLERVLNAIRMARRGPRGAWGLRGLLRMTCNHQACTASEVTVLVDEIAMDKEVPASPTCPCCESPLVFVAYESGLIPT
jgi:hypothetical protein